MTTDSVGGVTVVVGATVVDGASVVDGAKVVVESGVLLTAVIVNASWSPTRPL
jgi:hypothetical protein